MPQYLDAQTLLDLYDGVYAWERKDSSGFGFIHSDFVKFLFICVIIEIIGRSVADGLFYFMFVWRDFS